MNALPTRFVIKTNDMTHGPYFAPDLAAMVRGFETGQCTKLTPCPSGTPGVYLTPRRSRVVFIEDPKALIVGRFPHEPKSLST